VPVGFTYKVLAIALRDIDSLVAVYHNCSIRRAPLTKKGRSQRKPYLNHLWNLYPFWH